jgi:uncharacterized protein
MKGRVSAGLLVVICVLAVAACGSSGKALHSSSSAASSSSPSSSSVTGAPATAPTATTTAPTTGPTGTSRPPATTATTIPGGASIDGEEIDQLPQLPSSTSPVADEPLTGQALSSFLRSVFNDIQSTWAAEFSTAKVAYRPARLVLFSTITNTACGVEKSETGPFYCPADSTVYLDQSFFSAMERQFGVTGDFAPAYVIAHEVGHHVQSLLGITGRVSAADQSNPTATNAISVDVELQADCFAGVWAHSTDQRNLLEDGDLAEALRAAAAVGDDFISQAAGQPIAPEDWTHGSSSQRQHWLTVGFEQGTPDACDTFAS